MSNPEHIPGTNGHGYVLITGGSGFIGCNVAHRLLNQGHRILILDNLSRTGVIENYRWLRAMHGPSVELQVGDVRDREIVRKAVTHATAIFHFAAQVAVTTSLDDPIHDFEVNAAGTLNLLEAIRERSLPPPLFYTSTNKVYGHLGGLKLRSTARRYEPLDAPVGMTAVSEAQPLDFQSPYGCSKGTAEQYILDYHRSYGLKTCVFRMSCIYGPHQFGTEDQGWVAHFLISSLDQRQITLYGDGLQVRDILFVEDLAEAFHLAWEHIDSVAGKAFNIGGGPANTVSLLELLESIAKMTGRKPAINMKPWRAADQRYYVSNTTAFERATGWRPKFSVDAGLEQLLQWLEAARGRLCRSTLIQSARFDPLPCTTRSAS